jgi:hypothetical protein
MFKIFLTALSLYFACSSAVQAGAVDHQHRTWNALLQKHVHWLPDQHQTRTDYAGFKTDRSQLKTASAEFSAITQTEFDQWTPDQQKAFLINAYNAFTIELILSKYPDLKSIKDLGSLLQSPWKKEFFSLLGKPRHLDWIENDMLRPRYKDPRIHVGINCASIGCPALRNEAYVAAKLDAQLDDSMLHFLSDATRNRYRDGKLEVSEIFKWFATDFEKGYKGFSSVNDVFARYAARLNQDPSVQAQIRRKAVPVSYLPYDWMLNDSARAAR